MLEQNKIYCGDCQDVMQDIDNDSVDCIVTDPPYGMSFMGKDWDICPSIAIWQECLRVLKPGAFAFVMCIPRQDCLARMICRLEDAGFNISFSSIYHTFASGFPKAQNLSKQADKRAGVTREVIGMESTIPTRPITKNWKSSYGIPNNKGPFDSKSGCFREITAPATSQAKALDGAYGGFQPKPAVEIVIVAMKPLEEKTYVDQALKNGHGCTWLDDCRIPYRTKESSETVTRKPSKFKKNAISYVRQDEPLFGGTGHHKGRFPANVICENDALSDGNITKSAGGTGIRSQTDTFKGTEGREHFNCGDIGSFSRYFSLDAWFAERIKLLPKEAQKTFPWLIVPKASKGEKDRGCEELEGTMPFPSKNGSGNMLSSGDNNPQKTNGNYHPTCKPLKLMSWLITLASREGDIVLDPFCGSGTTAIAAKMLGMQYICIEKEEEYCEIARKRIAAIPLRLDTYNML